MGIGGIPDAVLSALKNHKDLGIHTEMFTDGVVPLVECGAINNAKKKIYKGNQNYKRNKPFSNLFNFTKKVSLRFDIFKVIGD